MVALTRVFVIMVASAAIGCEASKVGKAIKGFFTNLLKVRGETPFWGRDETLAQLAQEYPDCVNELKAGTQPIVVVHPNNSMSVTGMPAPCMSEVEKHNALPNIQELNAKEGSAIILGANSLLLENIDEEVIQFFKQHQKPT